MAMMKYGAAAVVNSSIAPGSWIEKKVSPGRVKVAKQIIGQHDVSEWLLSHVTIMASVDCDYADPKDPKSNYLIKPEHSIFVNNNADSWERSLLAATYRTFLTADNFVEHVQIPELSKGKILDVALREVPIAKDVSGKDITTLYVDLLVATNRKHADLIQKIESGEYNSLSMGCGLAGTPITLPDGTFKSIEDILEGDLVLSHTGAERHVTALFKKDVTVPLYTVKYIGGVDPLELTGEHPILIVKKSSVRCSKGTNVCHLNKEQSNCYRGSKVRGNVKLKCGRDKSTYEYAMEFVPISEVETGDYIARVYPTAEISSNIFASKELRRLVGMYAGDGYIGWQLYNKDTKSHSEKVYPAYVGFCLGYREVNLIEELNYLVSKVVKPGTTVTSKIAIERNGYYLNVYDKDLAKLFYDHIGEGSHSKTFSKDIMYLPPEQQLDIISGMMDTDGCYYTKTKSLHYSSSSSNLINQLHLMLLRNKIGNAREKVTRKGSGKKSSVNPYIQETIYISKTYSHLVPANKNKSFGMPPSNGLMKTFFHKNFYLSPITSVKRKMYSGMVYNFSVEEDESYAVNNAAVHNCLIKYSQCSQCGNIAADETEACKHIKYYKGNHFFDKQGVKRVVAELCFTGDHSVLTASGYYKSITDFSVGDKVVSHTGGLGEVLKVMERPYKGKIVSLKSEGSIKDLKSTPEHPHYVYDAKESVFKFKKAKDIAIGDYLTSPALRGEKPTEGFNKNKGFLLGLYAAEGWSGESLGSSKTEMVLNAEDELPLAKKASELMSIEFKPTLKKNGYEGVKKSWKDFLKLRKRVSLENCFEGIEISCRSCGAPKEYLTLFKGGKKYHCKLCRSRALLDLSSTEVKPSINLYDRSKVPHYIGGRCIPNDLSKKLVLSYYNKEFHTFVNKYCPGTRSFNKRLSQEVLNLPLEVQRQILVGWLIGDGSIDSELRLRGYTTSEQLFRSMEIIANRLGYWTRAQVVFGGKLIELGELRQKEDSIDNNGCHAMFILYFSPRDSGDLVEECGFYKGYPVKREETRKLDGYLLHKVTSTEEIDYEGLVYNLSVSGENSYIVDGLATHNCGRSEEPESCVFIDASWVRKPAFEGAVLRNIVDIKNDSNNQVSEAIQKAVNAPSPITEIQFAGSDLLAKAAGESMIDVRKNSAEKAADIVLREFTADEDGEAPASPDPSDSGDVEAPADDSGFPEAPEDLGTPEEGLEGEGDTDEGKSDSGGDAGLEGDLGGKEEEPTIEEPAEDATAKEVKDMFKRQILNDLRRELLKGEAKKKQEGRPVGLENDINESLIKDASSNDRLKNGIMILSNLKDWSNFKRYGYNRDDVLGIMYYIDKKAASEPFEEATVKALSRVKLASGDLKSFFTEIIFETGHKPNKTAAKKLVKWAQILNIFE